MLNIQWTKTVLNLSSAHNYIHVSILSLYVCTMISLVFPDTEPSSFRTSDHPKRKWVWSIFWFGSTKWMESFWDYPWSQKQSSTFILFRSKKSLVQDSANGLIFQFVCTSLAPSYGVPSQQCTASCTSKDQNILMLRRMKRNCLSFVSPLDFPFMCPCPCGWRSLITGVASKSFALISPMKKSTLGLPIRTRYLHKVLLNLGKRVFLPSLDG